MKEIELQSEFPCLVVTEENQIFLNPTDIINFKAENVLIYPVENRVLLPFKINFDDKKAKNYRFFEQDNIIYCFLFSSNVLSKKAIENIKVNNFTLEITLSKKDVVIKSSSEEIFLSVDNSNLEYICKSLENFLALVLKSKNKETLILYNPKTKKIKLFKGINFEFNQKEISFVQTLNDFAKSCYEKKIKIDKDEITEENSSFQKEKYYLQEETICYAFLDCIQNRNFNLARELLSNNFKNIKDEMFDDYFGKFVKFYPISKTKFLLVYPNENKFLNFKLEDSLICDFETIQ